MKNDQRPIVLVVEDNPEHRALIRLVLEGERSIRLLMVSRVRVTMRLLPIIFPRLALIILDGKVRDAVTPGLTFDMRHRGTGMGPFNGPILAASNHPGMQDAIMLMGGSHRVEKTDLTSMGELVRELLGNMGILQVKET